MVSFDDIDAMMSSSGFTATTAEEAIEQQISEGGDIVIEDSINTKEEETFATTPQEILATFNIFELMKEVVRRLFSGIEYNQMFLIGMACILLWLVLTHTDEL